MLTRFYSAYCNLIIYMYYILLPSTVEPFIPKLQRYLKKHKQKKGIVTHSPSQLEMGENVDGKKKISAFDHRNLATFGEG